MSAVADSWPKIAAGWKLDAEQAYVLNKDIVQFLTDGRADLQALAHALEQGHLGDDPEVLLALASMLSSLYNEVDQVCSQYRNALKHDWVDGQKFTPSQYGRWSRAATLTAWLFELIAAIESRVPAYHVEPKPVPAKLDLR